MNTLDSLLDHFCRAVEYPQASGFEVLELLDMRSTLAQGEGSLSEAAREKLEAADAVFFKHARHFYESVVQVADLPTMRKRAAAPPSHWWWYLEKLVETERAVG